MMKLWKNTNLKNLPAEKKYGNKKNDDQIW